jgi:hypothetical protein
MSDMLWVETGTGGPVAFTERITRNSYRSAEINEEMAAKGIPVEVWDTPFWRGKINEKLLKGVADNGEARRKYEAFMAEKKAEAEKPKPGRKPKKEEPE